MRAPKHLGRADAGASMTEYLAVLAVVVLVVLAVVTGGGTLLRDVVGSVECTPEQVEQGCGWGR